MAKNRKGRKAKKRQTQETNQKVRDLKDLLGGDFTDEEIRAVLQECQMDSEKAFNRLNDRLDPQATSQEVKTKRGRFGVLQNIDSHMVEEETSSTTNSSESDCSFTDCVCHCQFNDGSADDIFYDATDLSLEQEEKEDISLPIDTSTAVLPECVQGRDYLSFGTNNSDVNIAMPCDQSSPVESNLEGSANINGQIARCGIIEPQEVQVSEHNVTGENSSSNIAESDFSFTGEGDTCKVEGASQSNNGLVEDLASHNLPAEENENGHHQVGSGSSNNDIQATALSLDPFTEREEDKEVSSLSDNTSTTVLPEHVLAQDADFSRLSSGAINSDVNTATPSNESFPVENNLNVSSANLNGCSGNNSTLAALPAIKNRTYREYQPIYRGQGWELAALVESFLTESYRRSSLTGHNAASSSLQQPYPGDPHFPNTSSFNFRPCGNISAQTNSPRSMLDNFSTAPNQSGTCNFDVQRAQANNLAMPQQYPSASRTLPIIPSSTHFHGPARNRSRSRPPSIQGNRFYHSNQQRIPGIQRPNQLQQGTQTQSQPFLRFQSDLAGSRHRNLQREIRLLPRSNPANNFPQARSTALLPTNPDIFPPSSSNQSLQGHGQGRAGIIGPLTNSLGQSQRPSQTDAAFRPRDAGSSTALASTYQLFPRLSQPLLSRSIFPSTLLFSTSSYQNLQVQEELLSQGDDAFRPLPSFFPSDLLESSSDRIQDSSEEQEQS